MSVRVRFAPSPTGWLHVGGLRTALYNYLFAKKNNGKFILRIEDTDRTRLVGNAVENLTESLSWIGIEFDESPFKGGEYGPYVQSERLNLYKKYAEELIKNGFAYYAFDTAEELTAMRERQQQAKLDPKYDRMAMRNQLTLSESECRELLGAGDKHVIRLKIPDREVVFRDLIRGEIKISGKDIDDQVLMKSDGFPTYHLANVTDDHLMKISHVIRGEEWLPSTPKHVLLYEALGWDVPEFAHLPLLLNEKKAKLSKRHGDVSVEDFKTKGYISEAFLNFIALLGWNPRGDCEIYTMEELIGYFDLSKVNKGGAIFDRNKLEWMNAQYLRKKTDEELSTMLRKELYNSGFEEVNSAYAAQVAHLFKERVNFIHEIPAIADYMFKAPSEFDEKYLNKHWKEGTKELLEPLLTLYQAVDDFSHENTYALTKKYVEDKGIKFKEVIHPIRLMVTGKSQGAGMFETMEVLGKHESLNRIENFLNKMKK